VGVLVHTLALHMKGSSDREIERFTARPRGAAANGLQQFIERLSKVVTSVPIVVAILLTLFPLQTMAQNILIIPEDADCEPFVVSSELSAFIMSYHDGGSTSAVGEFSGTSGIDAYTISNWVYASDDEDDGPSAEIAPFITIADDVINFCEGSSEWQALLRTPTNSNGDENVMITLDTLKSWQENGVPTRVNDPLRNYMRSPEFIADWKLLKDALVGFRDCSTSLVQLVW